MKRVVSLMLVPLAGTALAQTILRKPEIPNESRIRLDYELPRSSKALEQAAAEIKRGAPVDDLQAWTLARVYFRHHRGACGGVGKPIDQGSFWLFHTAFGYSGDPDADIRIDKRTGRVSEKPSRPIRRVRAGSPRGRAPGAAARRAFR